MVERCDDDRVDNGRPTSPSHSGTAQCQGAHLGLKFPRPDLFLSVAKKYCDVFGTLIVTTSEPVCPGAPAPFPLVGHRHKFANEMRLLVAS